MIDSAKRVLVSGKLGGNYIFSIIDVYTYIWVYRYILYFYKGKTKKKKIQDRNWTVRIYQTNQMILIRSQH